MDRITIEPAIKIILGQIHTKLDEAARIAKAADACAKTALSPRAWLSRWISSN
jgi:hypothetical protein